MSDSDTYQLKVMHCPVCGYQCSHRAMVARSRDLCPRCYGAPLMSFRYDRVDHGQTQDITQSHYHASTVTT